MYGPERWNARYREPEFGYGKQPNVFFEEWLPQFHPGKILMPADGEGRNGIFAATLGWEVTAFDLSVEGQKKATRLADEFGVTLDYQVGDFADLEFTPAYFNAIGLIYAHFPANRKLAFHHRLTQYLKPGGVVIFEAFSKSHLPYKAKNPKVGGPGDLDTLFSIEEITQYFPDFEIHLLEEQVVSLDEGNYHVGEGAVIRFVGKKPK